MANYMKTLLNALRMRIATAQSTAETAQSSANKAQSTANAAQTSADEANNDILALTKAGVEWTRSNITSGNFDAIVYADGIWVAGYRYSGIGLYYSTRKVAYQSDLDGYISNGDDSIFLASSTEGSEKQFKLTVDDDGVLSVSEVT